MLAGRPQQQAWPLVAMWNAVGVSVPTAHQGVTDLVVDRLMISDCVPKRDDTALHGVRPIKISGIRSPQRFTWRPSLGIGTGILGLASLAWVATTQFGGSSSGTPPMQRFAVANGQRAAVTLQDGTHVLLNGGTTLLVPRDLNGSRTVELRGEAFFTVGHRASIPFIVQTVDARVTVLGTEFAVRRYATDHRMRVAVASGRVAVQRSTTGTSSRALVQEVLGAHMVAEVSDSGGIMLTSDSDTDVERATDWTRGRLVFRAAPVREVFPELERWYGVRIQLADSTLADQRITVTVTNEPPESILDGIALALGVRYVREGDLVTFLPHAHKTVHTRMEVFPRAREVSRGK